MRLRKSKGWLKPPHLPGPKPKKVHFQAQTWLDKRPPVPTCDSYSCCSQLLIALVRHNVRVPAPPSIKQTAALIMLLLYMFFSFFLAFIKIPLSKRPLQLVRNVQ